MIAHSLVLPPGSAPKPRTPNPEPSDVQERAAEQLLAFKTENTAAEQHTEQQVECACNETATAHPVALKELRRLGSNLAPK